ncbi:hypothetical protein BJX68DRAFT_251336 [Aspergillus pseudodeflectus]|uniref:Uncharacterized protein n=1 Tax=Aspergillus pseudodeflectus TaxID=176178 RepID=A0ABR4J7C6_9EURO
MVPQAVRKRLGLGLTPAGPATIILALGFTMPPCWASGSARRGRLKQRSTRSSAGSSCRPWT